MLSFPLILTVIFAMAGGLLGVILLVVLLPRRDEGGRRESSGFPSDDYEERRRSPGPGNGRRDFHASNRVEGALAFQGRTVFPAERRPCTWVQY